MVRKYTFYYLYGRNCILDSQIALRVTVLKNEFCLKNGEEMIKFK